jgi:hypothetical protein
VTASDIYLLRIFNTFFLVPISPHIIARSVPHILRNDCSLIPSVSQSGLPDISQSGLPDISNVSTHCLGKTFSPIPRCIPKVLFISKKNPNCLFTKLFPKKVFAQSNLYQATLPFIDVALAGWLGVYSGKIS